MQDQLKKYFHDHPDWERVYQRIVKHQVPVVLLVTSCDECDLIKIACLAGPEYRAYKQARGQIELLRNCSDCGNQIMFNEESFKLYEG